MAFTEQAVLATRARFPLLQSRVHLAACAHAPLLVDVLAALKRYEQSLRAEGMAWERWMQEVEETREAFASLIGAQAQEIALLPSVSDALSSLSSCLPLFGREHVVTTTQEFPSVAQVWLAGQAQWRNTVSVVPCPDSIVTPELLEPFLDGHTALVCISLVTHLEAAMPALRALADCVHACGALLFVDGSQGVGAVPVDVEASGIDLFASCAHTYLLGLPGLAFLYVRPGLTLTPTVTGWMARSDPFGPALSHVDYAAGASRFERGTPPLPQIYAAHAGIRLVQRLGVAAIARHLATLTTQTSQEASQRGWEVVSSPNPAQRGPCVVLRVGAQAERIAARLARLGMLVAARRDLIRLAPGCYSCPNDLDLALELLADTSERDLLGVPAPSWLQRRQAPAGIDELARRRRRRGKGTKTATYQPEDE